MKSKFITVIILIITSAYSQKGKTEYADFLIEAYYSNANKHFTSFYGGTRWNFPVPIDPEVILGENTKKFVSLPKDSYVVVEFVDNYIIDSPNQDDILISEIGCNGERAEVYVSTDGIKFSKLGIVDDCHNSTLDLRIINFESPVKYIKVVGMDNRGSSPGFDLASIRGLPNSSIAIDLNAPSVTSYVQEPVAIVDRKIIPDAILFNSNSSELDEKYREALSVLCTQLITNPDVDIEIVGHTDNIGNELSNINLSIERAQSVVEFLILNGVAKNRITFAGKGETEPLKSNATEDERKFNRRVELILK